MPATATINQAKENLQNIGEASFCVVNPLAPQLPELFTNISTPAQIDGEYVEELWAALAKLDPETVEMIRKLFDGGMFPLTLDGITRAMKALT